MPRIPFVPDEEDVTAIRAQIQDQLAEHFAAQRRRTAIQRYIEEGGDPEALLARADTLAKDDLAQAVRRATLHDEWVRTTTLVYERDNGICNVCLLDVPWEYYECGHIVDRCAGGHDRPSNLVCMCNACNRHKPVHETREAYLAWLEAGDWRAEIRALVRGRLLTPLALRATLPLFAKFAKQAKGGEAVENALSVSEAAERIGVSSQAVRNMIKARRLEKVGERMKGSRPEALISAASVEAEVRRRGLQENAEA